MSTIINHAEAIVNDLQEVIGTDAGGRGMKHLIVPNDLIQASSILANLAPEVGGLVLILSGFPCCVNRTPPTETDGPPGAVALARAVSQLGHKVKIVTEDGSNADVFRAALGDSSDDDSSNQYCTIETISAANDEDQRLRELAQKCQLILSCERAGPAKDGICYTMRGINMNEKGLIAPIHKLVEYSNCKFLAVGDGGNELGMGKVLDRIHEHIPRGDLIGCAIPADHLIAASVSNWGGYALAAGAAVMRAAKESRNSMEEFGPLVRDLVTRCLPTEAEEVALLHRCVAKGCRDGVSGKVEATVDGMPLERSLQCLREIRKTAQRDAI